MNRKEKIQQTPNNQQSSTARVFFNTTQMLQDTNAIKTKAAVMLIQATHFVQSKNLQKARQLFVQIADICTGIKQPDQQVLKWIEISCSCLGILHKNSQQKKFKPSNTQKKGWRNSENLLYLRYNKFSGQFVLDQYNQKDTVHKDVLRYVSKINMILFGCQNVQNSHSLYVMFSFYWIPLIFTLILLVLTFVFFATHSLFGLSTSSTINQQFEIPAMMAAGITILPLFMIFFKGLEQKDNTFFQKKLGQQINRINADCEKQKKNIFFMMPHGGQINVKIGKKDSDQKDVDNINQKSEQQEVNETPEDQFMDRIKGLTHEISKISGASMNSFKY